MPDIVSLVEDAISGEGSLDAVERAVEGGASVNSWSGSASPLLLAVKAAQPELVALLLRVRADPDITDSRGVSPLHTAVFDGVPEVTASLLDGKANVDTRDRHGQTPLFFAPHRCACTQLLEAAADVNVLNYKGQSALHLASHAGLNDSVRWLAVHCKPGIVNVQDRHGRTPAYCAARSNLRSTIRILQEHGADVAVRPHRMPKNSATLKILQDCHAAGRRASPDDDRSRASEREEQRRAEEAAADKIRMEEVAIKAARRRAQEEEEHRRQYDEEIRRRGEEKIKQMQEEEEKWRDIRKEEELALQEAETRRQEEELEKKRQEDEAEQRRQEEELERKRQEEEARLECERLEAIKKMQEDEERWRLIREEEERAGGAKDLNDERFLAQEEERQAQEILKEKLRQEAEAEVKRLAEEAAEKQRQEKEAEKKRLEEEAAEKQRQEAEAEEKKLEEEAAEKQRQEAEAEKQRQEAEAEKKRLEEEAASAAEKQKQEAEAEKKRLEDEAAEQQRQEAEAEEKKLAEEAAAEKQRQEAEAENKRLEEEAAEQQRQEAEAEEKRLEEEAAEKQRQEAEAEKKLEEEAAERKRQEADAEKRKLEEEAEQRRQKEEAEMQRQAEEEQPMLCKATTVTLHTPEMLEASPKRRAAKLLAAAHESGRLLPVLRQAAGITAKHRAKELLAGAHAGGKLMPVLRKAHGITSRDRAKELLTAAAASGNLMPTLRKAHNITAKDRAKELLLGASASGKLMPVLRKTQGITPKDRARSLLAHSVSNGKLDSALAKVLEPPEAAELSKPRDEEPPEESVAKSVVPLPMLEPPEAAELSKPRDEEPPEESVAKSVAPKPAEPVQPDSKATTATSFSAYYRSNMGTCPQMWDTLYSNFSTSPPNTAASKLGEPFIEPSISEWPEAAQETKAPPTAETTADSALGSTGPIEGDNRKDLQEAFIEAAASGRLVELLRSAHEELTEEPAAASSSSAVKPEVPNEAAFDRLPSVGTWCQALSTRACWSKDTPASDTVEDAAAAPMQETTAVAEATPSPVQAPLPIQEKAEEAPVDDLRAKLGDVLRRTHTDGTLSKVVAEVAPRQQQEPPVEEIMGRARSVIVNAHADGSLRTVTQEVYLMSTARALFTDAAKDGSLEQALRQYWTKASREDSNTAPPDAPKKVVPKDTETKKKAAACLLAANKNGSLEIALASRLPKAPEAQPSAPVAREVEAVPEELPAGTSVADAIDMATVQATEAEELEFHFQSLSLDEVDQTIFKKEFKECLGTLGATPEVLEQLDVKLRAGSVIAAVRGPVSAMQDLKQLPLDGNISVMGCTAQIASGATQTEERSDSKFCIWDTSSPPEKKDEDADRRALCRRLWVVLEQAAASGTLATALTKVHAQSSTDLPVEAICARLRVVLKDGAATGKLTAALEIVHSRGSPPAEDAALPEIPAQAAFDKLPSVGTWCQSLNTRAYWSKDTPVSDIVEDAAAAPVQETTTVAEATPSPVQADFFEPTVSEGIRNFDTLPSTGTWCQKRIGTLKILEAEVAISSEKATPSLVAEKPSEPPKSMCVNVLPLVDYYASHVKSCSLPYWSSLYNKFPRPEPSAPQAPPAVPASIVEQAPEESADVQKQASPSAAEREITTPALVEEKPAVIETTEPASRAALVDPVKLAVLTSLERCAVSWWDGIYSNFPQPERSAPVEEKPAEMEAIQTPQPEQSAPVQEQPAVVEAVETTEHARPAPIVDLAQLAAFTSLERCTSSWWDGIYSKFPQPERSAPVEEKPVVTETIEAASVKPAEPIAISSLEPKQVLPEPVEEAAFDRLPSVGTWCQSLNTRAYWSKEKPAVLETVEAPSVEPVEPVKPEALSSLDPKPQVETSEAEAPEVAAKSTAQLSFVAEPEVEVLPENTCLELPPAPSPCHSAGAESKDSLPIANSLAHALANSMADSVVEGHRIFGDNGSLLNAGTGTAEGTDVGTAAGMQSAAEVFSEPPPTDAGTLVGRQSAVSVVSEPPPTDAGTALGLQSAAEVISEAAPTEPSPSTAGPLPDEAVVEDAAAEAAAEDVTAVEKPEPTAESPEPPAEEPETKNDAAAEAAVAVETPEPTAESPEPLAEDPGAEPAGIEFRFDDLSLDKVDETVFKSEFNDCLGTLGATPEVLGQLDIQLRAGSIVAAVRGPVSAMQDLNKLPLDGNVSVMGSTAKVTRITPDSALPEGAAADSATGDVGVSAAAEATSAVAAGAAVGLGAAVGVAVGVAVGTAVADAIESPEDPVEATEAEKPSEEATEAPPAAAEEPKETVAEDAGAVEADKPDSTEAEKPGDTVAETAETEPAAEKPSEAVAEEAETAETGDTAEAAVAVETPEPMAESPEPLAEDPGAEPAGIEFRFDDLSLDKVDETVFKSEFKDCLGTLGATPDVLGQLDIQLRAGSIIAAVRGPVSAMQDLNKLPLDGNVSVMGSTASVTRITPDSALPEGAAADSATGDVEAAKPEAEEEAKPEAEEEAQQKAEDEAKLKAEEEAQQKAEEEAIVKAEEEAKQKAEEEANAQAEEEAQQKAEEEAKQKAKEEEEAQQKAEEEAKQKAEEEAKQKAEEEAKQKAEEEAQQKAEEEAKQKAEEEEAKVKAEEEAKQKAEEEAKVKAEEEAKQKAEEEAKAKAEEEAKQKAEEEAKQKAEEEATVKAEEEAKQKAEEEAKAKAEEEAKQKAEEETKQKAEEEAKQKAEEEAKQNAEEAAKVKTEEEAKKAAEDEAKLKAVKEEEEAKKKAEEEAKVKADEAKDKFEEAPRPKLKPSDKPIPKTEERMCLLWNVSLVKTSPSQRYGFSHSNGKDKFHRQRKRGGGNASNNVSGVDNSFNSSTPASPSSASNDTSFLYEAGPEALIVKRIVETGLLSDWNQVHPDADVRPNDRIIEVNGMRTINDMQKALRSPAVHMVIQRYPECFYVELTKREGARKLGFKFEKPRTNTPMLKITEVSAEGLLEDSNQQHLTSDASHLVVTAGMYIEVANDAEGDASRIAQVLRTAEAVRLRIRRSEASKGKRPQMRLNLGFHSQSGTGSVRGELPSPSATSLAPSAAPSTPISSHIC